MKLSALIVAAGLVLTSFTAATAACTPEEAQNKAVAFAAAIQEKSQKDPQGYVTVMQELQPRLLEIQQKQDVEAICAFYDEALTKLK